jgi:hypothetical protein
MSGATGQSHVLSTYDGIMGRRASSAVSVYGGRVGVSVGMADALTQLQMRREYRRKGGTLRDGMHV